jgi:hypothetical protein
MNFYQIRIATLTLIALFCTLAGVKAQTKPTLIYSAKNGQDKIILSTTISNMDSTKVGVRQIAISNNASMFPVINGKNDSVLNMGRMFSDTFNVSLAYPTLFYVGERLITKDTSGIIDTATAVSYIYLVVTPPFALPTQVLQDPMVGLTTASINADFNSGNDTAFVAITVSYGDTNYQNPSPFPSYIDTILPIVGQSSQVVSRSIGLNMNASNYKFSYKSRIWNSKGSILSKKFSGQTLPSPSPATVSSPQSTSATYDSLSFTNLVVTNGLKTIETKYTSKSISGAPVDSVVIIHKGQAMVVVSSRTLPAAASTNYYVWSCVRDTAFNIKNCSNRVLIQTAAKPIVFTASIDSNRNVGSSTQRVYFSALVPANHQATVYTVLTRFADQNTILNTPVTKTFASGMNNFYDDFTGVTLTAGEKYAVTFVAYDAPYSNSYSAWKLSDTFTFQVPQAPNTDAKIDSMYGAQVTLSSFSFKANVRLAGTTGTVTGYKSKSATGAAIDSSVIAIPTTNGVYTASFNFSADSSTDYYYWVKAISGSPFATPATTLRQMVRTSTPVTPPAPVAEPIYKVDSIYARHDTEFVVITMIVATGKTFDLHGEAALDPDTGFIGSFQIDKIATVPSGVHHYTWAIGKLYNGQMIYYTLYGANADTSLYLARKKFRGFFTFQWKAGVGIDLVATRSLHVYPNPAKDELHIPSTGEYVITDMQGQVVKTGSTVDSQAIDVSTLPKGLYFVKTPTTNTKFTKE